MRKETYGLTETFPKEELVVLVSQMNRAALSICLNIAVEGCGRNTNKQTCNLLNIARGSTTELEALIILSNDLGYIDSNRRTELEFKVDEIQRLLQGFKKSLLI